MIHLIDHNVDRERAKIVNDLILTNCVAGFELVERPHAPRSAHNATGEPLLTDGQVAVVQLNTCESPRLASETLDTKRVRRDGNRIVRGNRQFVLTARNSLLRDNIAWQGIEGIRVGMRVLRGSHPSGHDPKLPNDPKNEGIAIAEHHPSILRSPERSRRLLSDVEFSFNAGGFSARYPGRFLSRGR